jgi:hypothetical protein
LAAGAKTATEGRWAIVKRLLRSSTVIAVVAVASLVAGLGAAPASDGGDAAAKPGGKVKYKGKSKAGYPIQFTLVERNGRQRIKRLAVDVVTECWADHNDDGASDEVVARIGGLSGKVYRDGTIEVFYAPNEDTEYVVDGTLSESGKARMNVVVGGYFSADGVPDAGALECDNWGTIYKAKQRR